MLNHTAASTGTRSSYGHRLATAAAEKAIEVYVALTGAADEYNRLDESEVLAMADMLADMAENDGDTMARALRLAADICRERGVDFGPEGADWTVRKVAGWREHLAPVPDAVTLHLDCPELGPDFRGIDAE